VLIAAIGTSCAITGKFLRLIYAPFLKIWRIFCDFSACLFEISESNIIIISSFNNLLSAIVLFVSRCSLIEEIKE